MTLRCNCLRPNSDDEKWQRDLARNRFSCWLTQWCIQETTHDDVNRRKSVLLQILMTVIKPEYTTQISRNAEKFQGFYPDFPNDLFLMLDRHSDRIYQNAYIFSFIP
jgi:hypothetical protein